MEGGPRTDRLMAACIRHFIPRKAKIGSERFSVLAVPSFAIPKLRGIIDLDNKNRLIH